MVVENIFASVPLNLFFNVRFILSLASCNRCLVVDDQLNVLPVSSHSFEIKLMNTESCNEELKELKDTMQDTQPVGSLVNCCCTLDQVGISVLMIDFSNNYVFQTF